MLTTHVQAHKAHFAVHACTTCTAAQLSSTDGDSAPVRMPRLKVPPTQDPAASHHDSEQPASKSMWPRKFEQSEEKCPMNQEQANNYSKAVSRVQDAKVSEAEPQDALPANASRVDHVHIMPSARCITCVDLGQSHCSHCRNRTGQPARVPRLVKAVALCSGKRHAWGEIRRRRCCLVN